MGWYRLKKERLSVTELRVKLDPLNPGQFFACCGLFELVTLEDLNALACFAPDAVLPREQQFAITGLPRALDIKAILSRLKEARCEFPDENIESSIRPAALLYHHTRLDLDWWLDEFRDKTVSLKCWAGQVTTRKLFSELLPQLDENTSALDLFHAAHMTKSKFGVDPRSAWNALDLGFSPDKHGRDSATFPAVEVLAAIGLQGFRPDASSRARVSYSLWQIPLPAAVARQAFRAPWKGLPVRRCEFPIQQRGQSYKYFAFANYSDKEHPTYEY
jgi:CRISPR-associated protein Csb3